VTAGWEAGHAVLVALACWVVAVGILAGMVMAAVVRGVVGAWRWLCASVAAVRAWQAFRSTGPAERPAEALLWLRAAPVPPAGPPATGPSRSRGTHQSAPRGGHGAFPAPPTQRPAQSHSETSSKETA